MRERLAWMMATACVLAACATGVDSPNDGLSGGDSGDTVETSSGGSSGSSSGQDAAGSGGQDAAVARDTGSSTQDGGTTGDDASETDDAPSIEEAAVTQDSGTIQDTGTLGQDTGTTTGGQCPDSAKYDLEAVAVIASGNFTLCLTGVCSGASQCCFEGLSPGNVCVAE
jgi:hypothetical protein